MIKTLFFDIYQTLLDVDIEQKNKNKAWKVFENYLISRGVHKTKAAKFNSYFDQAEENFYSKRSKILHHHDLIDNVYEVMQNNYQISISDNEAKKLLWDFRQISCDFCNIYPGVKKTLSYLSKSYTLSTASLGHKSIAERELQKAGILKYFSYVNLTSNIGYRKGPRFFREILKLSGTKSSQAVMIGDNLQDDIYNAKQEGMKTIWIRNPITMLSKNVDVQPDFSVDIQNFPEIISKVDVLNTR